MIIIKIIILYFIQIKHTADFPSTGISARTCKSANNFIELVCISRQAGTTLM